MKKDEKKQQKESIRLCEAFRKIFYLRTNEIYLKKKHPNLSFNAKLMQNLKIGCTQVKNRRRTFMFLIHFKVRAS